MTNEEIRTVVQALANYRQINMNWHKDVENTAERLQDFIGKPDLTVTASTEPHYRPFKNAEEVMEAIKIHGNMLKRKYDKVCSFIIEFTNDTIYYGTSSCEFSVAYDYVIFADGTPFGKEADYE